MQVRRACCTLVLVFTSLACATSAAQLAPAEPRDGAVRPRGAARAAQPAWDPESRRRSREPLLGGVWLSGPPYAAGAWAPLLLARSPAAAPPATVDVQLLAEPPVAPPSAAPQGPPSSRLPSGLYNPMPGGVVAGYGADTGLDIAGSPRAVYAIAAGWLDYAEPGHTRWKGPGDTDNAVRIELDVPIAYQGRRVTHVWYAHLSALATSQPEGHEPRARVEAGQLLGTSGRANGSPHLHIGLLLDGDTSQRWGSYLLEDEVRAVLGPWERGTHLPDR